METQEMTDYTSIIGSVYDYATGYVNTGYTISATSDQGSTVVAWYAFDGSDSTIWASAGAIPFTSIAPQNLQIQFTVEPQTVTRYSLRCDTIDESSPRAWDFQGSNNGSDWTTLDTQANQYFQNLGSETKTFDIANSASYNYYRISCTETNQTYVQITEFKIYTSSQTPPTPPATKYVTFINGVRTLQQVKTSQLNNDADYTIMGNEFNSASELVKLDSESKLPAVDGSQLTGITSSQVGLGNVSNVDTTDADNISSGTLSDERLSSNVTLMGNEFNNASELVKLDSESKLPAVDGSQLTGITPTQVGLGNVDNVQQIPMSYLDTDETLGGVDASDSKVASQKATKAYVDQIIAATGALVFKGNIDCASNPNYPEAIVGDVYVVSVAGKIGGASGIVVEPNDTIYCITDNDGGTQAQVGADFIVVQANIDGAVVGPASAVDDNIAIFDGTTGKLIADGGVKISDLVPTSRTINGYDLSDDVSLTASDVGLGNVANVDTTDADNISSGTLSDERLSSNVTLMGNEFNGDNELVKLDSESKLPAVDGSQLTGITPSQVGLGNVSNVDTTDADNISSGTLSDERLSSNVTLMGNEFNNASELVKLDSESKLPAVDGSLLTGITPSQVGLGNVSNVDTTDADNISSGTLSDERLSSNVTLMGNEFNGDNELVKLDSESKLPAVDGSQLTGITPSQVGLGNVSNVDTTDADNISSGTLSDERLSSNVTLAGNEFNGNSELVQTDSEGKLPALDGSALTNLNTIKVVASENLTAGDFINTFDDNGTVKVRKANATDNTKPAVGFVLESCDADDTVVVHLIGSNTALSGLTMNVEYYLSTTSGAITTTAPSEVGNIIQSIGRAALPTSISFQAIDIIEIGE